MASNSKIHAGRCFGGTIELTVAGESLGAGYFRRNE